MTSLGDWLRQRLLSTKCIQLVHYDGVNLRMQAIESAVESLNISLGSITVHRKLLQQASEAAKVLDAYQFYMCNLCRSTNKGKKKNWYCREMVAGILRLTAFQVCVSAL